MLSVYSAASALLCSLLLSGCNLGGAARMALWAMTEPPTYRKLEDSGNMRGNARVGTRFRLKCHGWIVEGSGERSFVVAKYERPMTWEETLRNADHLAPAVRSGTRFVVTRFDARGFSSCAVYGKIDGVSGEILLNEVMDISQTSDDIGRIDARPEYCAPQ